MSAFRVHVAGDLNKTISFVVGRRYLDFIRSCLTRAHPLYLVIFKNKINIRLDYFLSNGFV